MIALNNEIEIWVNPLTTQAVPSMYKKKAGKDWMSAVVTASLGAGAVTTFAISQGQHPLMAFGITAFAVSAALLIDHYA